MEKIDLIEAIIINSIAFKCEQITYEIDKESSQAIVRNSDSDSVCFNATELINTLDNVCDCYLKIEKGRVVLIAY